MKIMSVHKSKFQTPLCFINTIIIINIITIAINIIIITIMAREGKLKPCPTSDSNIIIKHMTRSAFFETLSFCPFHDNHS